MCVTCRVRDSCMKLNVSLVLVACAYLCISYAYIYDMR